MTTTWTAKLSICVQNKGKICNSPGGVSDSLPAIYSNYHSNLPVSLVSDVVNWWQFIEINRNHHHIKACILVYSKKIVDGRFHFVRLPDSCPVCRHRSPDYWGLNISDGNITYLMSDLQLMKLKVIKAPFWKKRLAFYYYMCISTFHTYICNKLEHNIFFGLSDLLIF